MPQPSPESLPSDFLPEGGAIALDIFEDATLSLAPQGMTSEVAFLDDRGRSSVLKRCRDPIYVEWLRREHRVLVALSECSLRAPRVIGYHEVRANGEVADAWLHMTRLPGESLWHVLLRSGPLERSDLFRKLGHLLRELHSTPPPAVFVGQASWTKRKLREARENLAWCDGSAELLGRLEATPPAPAPEVLIHGDLALDNVLVEEDGGMGLIDWSGGDRGDPRYDLSLALGTEPEIQRREADRAAFFEG
ncbi:MAG: phosphotransferase family protein, partial [Vicinamibacteria bacterium]